VGSVRRYIPKAKGIVPLLPGTIHGTHYIWVYQWALVVGIYLKQGELFPSHASDNN